MNNQAHQALLKAWINLDQCIDEGLRVPGPFEGFVAYMQRTAGMRYISSIRTDPCFENPSYLGWSFLQYHPCYHAERATIDPGVLSIFPGPPAVQVAGQPVVQTAGQGAGHVSGYGAGQAAKQGTGQVVGQPVVQIAGQGAAQVVGQGVRQVAGQPAVQIAGQGAGQVVGQSAVQTSGQPTAYTAGQGAAQVTGQGAGQAIGQGAGQAVGQGGDDEIRFAPPNDWGAVEYADLEERGGEQFDHVPATAIGRLQPESGEEQQEPEQALAGEVIVISDTEEAPRNELEDDEEEAGGLGEEPVEGWIEELDEDVIDSIEDPAPPCDGGHPDGPFQADQFQVPYCCPCGAHDATGPMIQCSNIEAHNGELWFHWSCAGFTRDRMQRK